MKVADLMSTDLITVERDTDLGVALALMVEFDVHHLPVVEGTHFVGIISDRDLRLAMESPFRDYGDDTERAADALEAIVVDEVMSTSLVVIGPDDSVGEAARRLVSHRVSLLPVVEMDEDGDAVLIGVLSITDLLRYLADLEGEREAEG